MLKVKLSEGCGRKSCMELSMSKGLSGVMCRQVSNFEYFIFCVWLGVHSCSIISVPPPRQSGIYLGRNLLIVIYNFFNKDYYCLAFHSILTSTMVEQHQKFRLSTITIIFPPGHPQQ
jgi:hypothetical protein